VFHSAPNVIELAKAAGITNVTQLKPEDGAGKGFALYQVDLSNDACKLAARAALASPVRACTDVTPQAKALMRAEKRRSRRRARCSHRRRGRAVVPQRTTWA